MQYRVDKMHDCGAETLLSRLQEHGLQTNALKGQSDWQQKRASQWIECLFCDLPQAPLIVDGINDPWVIIDGRQRIKALVSFFNDGFVLAGMEIATSLEGKYFSQFTRFEKRCLRNAVMPVWLLLPGCNESVREILFKRYH